MAALSAIHRFANRLREKGKVFKVVITACMRKLLMILNTMLRNQTLWRPEKTKKTFDFKHSRSVSTKYFEN